MKKNKSRSKKLIDVLQPVLYAYEKKHTGLLDIGKDNFLGIVLVMTNQTTWIDTSVP